MIATLQHNIREMHATKRLPSFVQVLVTMEQARDDIVQLTGAKAALQTEIERLRSLCDSISDDAERHLKEIERLQKIIDGTERRECEYLALIESKSDAIDRLSLQWGVAKKEAEAEIESLKMALIKATAENAQRFALLQERNDEIARLRGDNTKLLSENERLKAERHTTKRMLEDILDKHSVERPGRP